MNKTLKIYTKDLKYFYSYLQKTVKKFYGTKCLERVFGCSTCMAHHTLEDIKVLVDEIIMLEDIDKKDKKCQKH